MTTDWVIGSDEAGYGTWAGHLVVAGVAAPASWNDPEVKDSKKFTRPGVREAIVRRYRNSDVLHWYVVGVSPEEIDRTTVWQCLIQAHNAVHAELRTRVQGSRTHIVDGLTNAKSLLDPELTPLVKADTKIPAVSLASCFAKVLQCHLMDEAHRKYPEYSFDTARGYGTKNHKKALEQHGPCPLHRRSYAPIRDLISHRSRLSGGSH